MDFNLGLSGLPLQVGVSDLGQLTEEQKKKKKLGQDMAQQIQQAGGPVEGVNAQMQSKDTDNDGKVSWDEKKPKGFARKLKKGLMQMQGEPQQPSQQDLLAMLMGAGGGQRGGGMFGY